MADTVKMMRWVCGEDVESNAGDIAMDPPDAIRHLSMLQLLLARGDWTDPDRWARPLVELRAAYEKAEAEEARPNRLDTFADGSEKPKPRNGSTMTLVPPDEPDED